MKPTEILENEHRIIEQVLSCLEKAADLTEKSKQIDGNPARDMIDFFRMFADRFHHAKEEQHLFACLEAHGMPRDGGPTGVMLAEHQMGRDLVGKMEKAVTAYEQGSGTAPKDFTTAARAYVSLLREHIQKEDHCLFAMTNDNLSDQEQERLLKAFRAEEERSSKERPLDYYPKKAKELGERFQVRSCGPQGAPTPACGHHKPGSCGGF